MPDLIDTPKIPEMVERVARAIHDERIFVINSDAPDAVRFDDTTLENQVRYRQLARAAIKAIRNPTEGMIDAANPSIDRMETSWDQITGVWRAMIDAALGR